VTRLLALLGYIAVITAVASPLLADASGARFVVVAGVYYAALWAGVSAAHDVAGKQRPAHQRGGIGARVGADDAG
jgi:hypothetical protein